MPWPCANQGGEGSLISLERIPALDREVALPLQSVRALVFWQARVGQIVTLRGPEHRYFRGRLTAVGDREATVVPFFEFSRPVESPLNLTVFQALPEKERFEWILQKLTEIGVQRIVPFHSLRSTTLRQRNATQEKSHRWPSVLLRAARQCRRAIIPELAPVVEWSQMLEESAESDQALLFYEGQGQQGLSGVLPRRGPKNLGLIVGPEGGFTEEEIVSAQKNRVEIVTLGPRILRTETAAIVAATACQVLYGDLVSS